MKRSYVCKFLSSMEERGLIKRKNAIRGERQVIIQNFITKKGEKAYKKVRDHFIETFEGADYESEREILKTTTNTLFDMAARIKKEFDLKF